MQQYRNFHGGSGVESFEVGDNFILVRFSGSAKVYRYSYGKAGVVHVELMKSLALGGKGLNSYINSYTKHLND